MKVKSVFLKSVSRRVRIIQSETKKELADELVTFHPNASKLHYTAWVLENFVVSINNLFSEAIDQYDGLGTDVDMVREELYSNILKLNPLLDPDNLYISESNTVTLTKTPIKLVDCSSWNEETDDPSSLMMLDTNDYFKFMENARQFDHYVETEEWSLCDGLFVSIRLFDKAVKAELVHGFIPKSEDEVKYFIVATCVDNFHQLYSYIVTDANLSLIPFPKVIYSLYDLCVKHNSFLNLKIKDFQRLSKKYKVFKEGKDEEGVEVGRIRKHLTSVPKKDILNLEQTLNNHIFGQEEAVEAVVSAVKRAYGGLKSPNTPIGTFFFLGPTSTGKTEFAKVLAKSLTNSSEGLVKIPCNTLAASHSVATLLGSPPGYVGYEENGLLEKSLKASKFKIILFDEIEKANDKLFDIVLEVMEEGQLLTANGEVLDFSNCLILFTSNIGQQEAVKAANSTGFASAAINYEEKETLLSSKYHLALSKKMKPEFLARLNGVFYFKRLEDNNLIKSAERTMQDISKNLARRKLKLRYSSNLGKFILDQCKVYKLEPHPRDLRTFIDMTLMRKVGDFVLTLKENDRLKNYIKLDVEGGDVVVTLETIEQDSKHLKRRY